ncbi:MAG: TRAP transporter small permease [Planctomycetaceae bacterium]|nr:TRAP transporter small permease [Planctomycetaceae bacterium]
MNALRKAIAVGMRIQSVIGALCLIVIVVLITASIIMRYLFNSPLAWTEELITFVFIWLSFLGAGVVAGKRHHVAVDFITDKFTGKQWYYIRLATILLIMALLVVMCVSTVMLLPSLRHVSVTLRIPRYFYNIPILIASFYMLLVYLEDLLTLLRSAATHPEAQ